MDLLLLFILISTSEAYAVSSLWSSKQIKNVTSHNEKVVPEVPRRPTEVVKQNRICQTDECKNAAEELLKNMNRSADPCEDFYDFACGGWAKEHPMPKTEARWDQFLIVSEKIQYEIKDILESNIDLSEPGPVNATKVVYKACMERNSSDNPENLKPLLDLMSKMGGGWPMVSGNQWKSENFVWYETAADINSQLSSSSITDFGVEIDQKNSSSYVIAVGQPSFVLSREMLVKPSTYKRQVEAYKKLLIETAWVLAKAVGSPDVTRSSISHEAEEMVEFEMKLANLTSPPEMRRNLERMYNPMTLQGLQDLSNLAAPNQVDWLKFVKRLTTNLSLTLDWSERVIVDEPDYIFKSMQLLNETPPRVIANYLQWIIVQRFAGDLTAKLHQLTFEFGSVLSGVTNDQPRWKECIGSVYYDLGMALGYSYVQKNFDNSSRLVALEMVDNIKSAFSEKVGKLDWMDAETKERARHKAAAMSQHIGYPSWLANSSALEIYYKGLEVSEIHFNNLLYSSRFNFFKNFKKLRTPVDRDEWELSPATVNAQYDAQQNAITFPAAILQPPFFKKSRLEALNYGEIGAVIGHEITHGFDDQGRQFDAEGNMAQWWSEKTLETYLNKSQCFIQQYGGYRVTELDGMSTTGIKLNGVTTLGENIADNGGLNSALAAYRKYVAKSGAEPSLPGLESYTAEQLFFIAFANNWCGTITKETLLNLVLTDSHSPNRYRVIGTVQNSQDFAKAFNCPKKNVDACVIW